MIDDYDWSASGMSTEIERLEAEIAQRDARIAELEASLDRKVEFMRQLAKDGAKLDDQIAALKAQPLSLTMELETEGWWNESHDVYTWPIRIGNWGGRVECHGDTPEEARQLALSVVCAQAQQPSAGVVLPTVEQLAIALGKVRCFHDLSAELIAPDLLENLREVVGDGGTDERAAIQSDISCDSAYRNGLIAGFGFGINDDEAGYKRSVACYQSEIHEARAALNAGSAVPDVYAMARVLAYRCADACNVDRDDYWKQYGEDCIEDVRAMLAAAPSAKQQGGE